VSSKNDQSHLLKLQREESNVSSDSNGRSGEELHRREKPNHPDGRNAIRTQRTKLQSALLSAIRPGTIQLAKKLTRMDYQRPSGIALTFKDGSSTTADLVVGADGIRSVRAAMAQSSYHILTDES
jgi:salicylate hydroxylase